MARKPWVPKTSWTTSARISSPSIPRPYCCQSTENLSPDSSGLPRRICGRGVFTFVFRSALQYPVSSFLGQLCGSRRAVCFNVQSQQRFGAAQTCQHPRPIIEYEFCTVGAINGYNFAAQECRTVYRDLVDRVCFLFVAKMQIFSDGPKFPAQFLEHLLSLFAQRRTSRRNHLGHQQASQNPVFLRDVPANRESGALFAAQR